MSQKVGNIADRDFAVLDEGTIIADVAK